LNAIPHIGRLMDSSVQTLLEWADYLVVTQKQTGTVADAIRSSGRPVLDLTRPNIRTASEIPASVK
jgi:GDP-mannose 6-dehydrogenase